MRGQDNRRLLRCKVRKNRRSGSGRADIMKEIDIMRLTKDQPRIIQMREVFESQREMIIVLEL